MTEPHGVRVPGVGNRCVLELPWWDAGLAQIAEKPVPT